MKQNQNNTECTVKNLLLAYIRKYSIFALVALIFSFIGIEKSHAQAIGDPLCPEPKISSRQSPSDLANIQSDIERFTLCIERAELLNRLNRLVEENDALMGLTFGGGQASAQPPAAPTNAPTATTPLPDVNMSDSVNARQGQNEETEEDSEDNIWVIEEIFGVSSDLQARLTNADS